MFQMKKIIIMVAFISLVFTFPGVAFADYGINNHIIGQEVQTSENTTSFNQNSQDAILATIDGKKITLPDRESYFEEPQVMYISASKGHSTYAYRRPVADTIVAYPYHGSKVLAVAAQKGFTCILYTDQKNDLRAVWVRSSQLTDVFPGVEQTIGEQYDTYYYNFGDIPVFWSEENFIGTSQKFSILKEPAYSCIQFTLDYQVVSRGDAIRPDQVYGPRTVYVNDGSGWVAVGEFDYSKFNAVHVVVNLPEPMDLLAVATVASCEKPDSFRFRQGILDVLIDDT